MKLINLISVSLCFSTVFLLSACNNGGGSSVSNKKTDTNGHKMQAFFGSGYTGSAVFIPTDSANKMINSYLQSVNSGSGNDSALHSLIFDADSLRAYLSNTSIKHVKVMFAHTLEYINQKGSGHNVGYESGALTVIFGGYNAEGNYVFWQGNSVPNHGAPCPSNCVSSGNASSDLFPQ
ncbi:MAG: hypothetical protein ABI169_05620 [Chitinophagaceae bacterium]